MHFTYSEEIRGGLRWRYRELAARARGRLWPDPVEPCTAAIRQLSAVIRTQRRQRDGPRGLVRSIVQADAASKHLQSIKWRFLHLFKSALVDCKMRFVIQRPAFVFFFRNFFRELARGTSRLHSDSFEWRVGVLPTPA